MAQARAEQQDIWLAVAEKGVRAADGVIDRIDEVIFMLAQQPDLLHHRSRNARHSRIMHGARDINVEMFDD